MDLLQYAARGAPELSVDKLANYQPKHPDATGEPPKGGPADIISRLLHTIPDDGHSIKLGRAAVICHDICRKFEDDPHHQPHDWLVIRGDDMWRRVCHLIVDSVEVTSGPRWVRSTGFEEAWKVSLFYYVYLFILFFSLPKGWIMCGRWRLMSWSYVGCSGCGGLRRSSWLPMGYEIAGTGDDEKGEEASHTAIIYHDHKLNTGHQDCQTHGITLYFPTPVP
jgi:hypothetical protein